MGQVELLKLGKDRFRSRFGRPPRFVVAAPGRVNLIGEHTDYNDGFVLPMAIERRTMMVADRAAGGCATVCSAGQPEASFPVDSALAPGEPAWSNYVRGVVAGCLQRGLDPGGFDAVIVSDVPTGGGLSSSAALEVATATLIEAITGRTLDPVEKALLCQTAEHQFPGVPCGIMDQFIVTMGRAGCALLLDCRDHSTRLVALGDDSVTVLIANTNVRHELSGGEYAQRRAQCESAARALGVRALRDADPSRLDTIPDAVCRRRARHVVSENARTLEAAEHLAAGRWRCAGELMNQSHDSLRDDLAVSCPELDLMVELARRQEGVFGSRMTGGGFGGCTVSLVRTDRVTAVSRALHAGYLKQTGIEPTLFATRPADGAKAITHEDCRMTNVERNPNDPMSNDQT